MLSKKQRKIARIASCTAVSDTVRLAEELHAGLDAGLSINEIKEIFIQLCLYCGYPRGLRAIDIFIEVLDNRKIKGIRDETGKAPSPVNSVLSKYERGEQVQLVVTGWTKEELRSGAMRFIPKIDMQLKEYIFADVYDSDVLNYADREIATVSAQLSMDGIEPQIRAHINAALNVGVTESQLRDIISIIELEFGAEKGIRGRDLLSEVLSKRTK